ncbi:MAG TPA: MltA domain-containing protein, partial [Burkholderiales bacterium]|nr:MltA domain-containing protein [Burkholderiales bacterium]
MLLLTTACETRAPVKELSPPPGSAAPAAPAPVPHPIAPPSTQRVPTASGAALRPAAWNDLPAWRDEDHAAAWEALRTSCSVLAHRDAWRSVCSLAFQSERPDRAKARRFFETHFAPYQLVNADGRAEGLITGYYEPLLRGSRQRSARYRHPVYGVPDDLLVVDLGELYTELKGKQLRGRLDGRRIVPYYDRAGIEGGLAPVRGREIAWVEDPIELFFLQIQGSGRIELENGSTLRVGFADQNGHP